MVKKNKQLGGDGYVTNVNEAIGGLPGITRYSNNYRPIFDGELLQNGGDGYSVNVSPTDIGGKPVISRYTYFDTPVFKGDLLQNGGGDDCGCGGDNTSNDPTIFELIKQGGGNKKVKKNITQYHAIEKVSYILSPLSLNALIILIVKIILKLLFDLKPKKTKQLGGYAEKLQEIIAPLGKNNLLVLASLLLLHHFAVESKMFKKSELSGGGDPFSTTISNILTPLGVNSLGSSLVLVLLQQAFVNKKLFFNKKEYVNQKEIINKKEYFNQQGGNPLKNLIAPLGTDAFIATGLLIVLEKLFVAKMNEIKSTTNEKKILIGGKVNKKFEELFNMIAPITFNAFAKESFLKKMVINKKKNINNKS